MVAQRLAICGSILLVGVLPAVAAKPREAPVSVRLPSGWHFKWIDENEFEFVSPPMKLNPSKATGLPAGQVTKPFELSVSIHTKISEKDLAERVKKNNTLREKIPDGYGKSPLPPEYEALERQIKPEPDFYDDRQSYELSWPSHYPDSPIDREHVLTIYQQLRKKWHVYPTSRHANAKYYPTLLKDGLPPRDNE